MLFSRGPKYGPPKWAMDAGEVVYYGIIVLYVVTILFGLAIVLLS